MTTVPNIYTVRLHDDPLRGADKNKAISTFFFFHDVILYSRDKNIILTSSGGSLSVFVIW